MSRITPPRLPAWMLEHLNAGKGNDALTGDLVEEFHHGRSVVWYWRQAIAALVIGWLRNIRNHRNLMVFTALWSMLAPGWTMIAMRVTEHQAEVWHLWRLNWPWSSLCSAALFFVPGLIFIWAGLALYLIAEMRTLHHFNLWRIGRSLLLSILLFIGVSCAVAGSVPLYKLIGHSNWRRGSTLSIAPDAPLIVPRAVGGGREVTIIRDKRGVATTLSSTRVYIEPPNSPWAPKPYLLDRNVSAADTLSPWGAITEAGVWAIVNRLPFFLSLLFALWTTGRATSELKNTAE